jgi:DNA-directed RNA polymerase specialized sigma24 family protein
MLKPIKGMTEEQVMAVINKVCKRSMNKYKIDGLLPDDLYQESFIICMHALDRFDELRPLENFLAFNLSRRIKTLYRNITIKRINFVCIDDVPPELLWDDRKENIQEFVNLINDKMPVDMRHDYIKYVQGVSIPRIRKQKLLKKLKEYSDEFWNK